MDYMNQLLTLLKYIFLGLFQGFTEPIPISSSGHVVLLREFFELKIPGLSFEIFIHFGSLLAIISVYRSELIRIIKNSFHYLQKKNINARQDFHLSLLLIVATLPAAIVGLFFEATINKLLSYTYLIGISLIITGVFLWIIRKRRGKIGDGDLTIRHAFLIGLAQALAVFPGISRSGSTIVAAMLLGLKREVALKFSFLLYIPISFGATILSLRDFVSDPFLQTLLIPYILAFSAAVIATYFSLRWFINLMMRGNLKYFSYYCFFVGIYVTIYFL